MIPAGSLDRLLDLLRALRCGDHHVLDHLEGRGADAPLGAAAEPAELMARAARLLDNVLPPRLAPLPVRVAVHDSCGLAGQGGFAETTRRLLRRVGGLTVLAPAEPEVCCGGSWGYALRYPDLSRRMGLRKGRYLAQTGCQLVIVTDPDCLGQVAGGLAIVAPSVPVVLLTDLLWYAWVKAGAGPGDGQEP